MLGYRQCFKRKRQCKILRKQLFEPLGRYTAFFLDKIEFPYRFDRFTFVEFESTACRKGYPLDNFYSFQDDIGQFDRHVTSWTIRIEYLLDGITMQNLCDDLQQYL